MQSNVLMQIYFDYKAEITQVVIGLILTTGLLLL